MFNQPLLNPFKILHLELPRLLLSTFPDNAPTIKSVPKLILTLLALELVEELVRCHVLKEAVVGAFADALVLFTISSEMDVRIFRNLRTIGLWLLWEQTLPRVLEACSLEAIRAVCC